MVPCDKLLLQSFFSVLLCVAVVNLPVAMLLRVFVSITPFFLRRLPVQTVSHEPLLGPEAVLESGEAWREHRRCAPQQAACEQSDDTCTSVPPSQTPLPSFMCVGGISQTEEKQHLLLRTLPVRGVHVLPFCLLSSCSTAAPFKAA